MIAAVSSAVLLGVQGRKILVEVHVSDGLPGFTIVGLPDAACREARDRVRAALLSSGLPWSMRRVTVNLAPSGVRKAGAGLDLAIAVGSSLPAARSTPRPSPAVVHRRTRSGRNPSVGARRTAGRGGYQERGGRRAVGRGS